MLGRTAVLSAMLLLACSPDGQLTRGEAKKALENTDWYKAGTWVWIRSQSHYGDCASMAPNTLVDAGYLLKTYQMPYCYTRPAPAYSTLPTWEGDKSELGSFNLLRSTTGDGEVNVRLSRYVGVEVLGIRLDPGGTTARVSFSVQRQLTDSAQRYIDQETLLREAKPRDVMLNFEKYDDGWRPVGVPRGGRN